MNGLRVFTPGTVTVYRSRVFATDQLPQAVAELSYPPADNAPLARANREGVPVFYGAADLPTALAESKAKAGDRVVVAKWINIKALRLVQLGRKNSVAESDKLLRELFTNRDESFYAYSARIAEHIMNQDQVDGIVYPAAAGESYNTAMKKAFVDEGMKMVNAVGYLIKSLKDGAFDVERIARAEASSGLLVWKSA